jgi:hypothetical protein
LSWVHRCLLTGLLCCLLCPWIGGDIARAAQILAAQNDDLQVWVSIEKGYGHLIGDVIPLDIVIVPRTEGLQIREGNLPSRGTLGDFEVVRLDKKEKKDRIIFSYRIQTFLAPKQSPALSLGDIRFQYTAKKYWSEADQRHTFQSISLAPFELFQTSLDPQDRLSPSHTFEFLNHSRRLSYPLLVLGLVLLTVSFWPHLKRLWNVARGRHKEERAFLKKIIRGGLSFHDPVLLCTRLNGIRRNDVCRKFLYGGYPPREEEIKKVATRILRELQGKKDAR